MALTVLTLDELQVNAKAAIRSRFPTRSAHDESWLTKQANALAGLIWSLHDKAQQADWDATPQAKSSYAALALWAYVLGLPDGAGGYGALVATGAQGLTLRITGTPATVVWNGSGDSPEWAAPDGETTFVLVGAATIGGSGYVDASINAVTAGTAGNLAAADALTLTSTIPGVDNGSTIQSGPTTAGQDAEDKGSLLGRVTYALSHPPKAITAPDLREIAQAATYQTERVVRAYVYPRRYGTGTADVVPLVSGSGTARRPSTNLVAAVQAALTAERNVGAEGIRALRATVNSGHAIRVRGTASTQYPWDWDSSTGGPWTIDSIVDSTHIKLSTLAPTDLKAAIDAGSKPRIQIKQTGSVLPVVHRCTAYSDGGGKTTLTIETAYTAAPTVGDAVYAGASFVTTIAQALLDYVDELGPSLLSGYADTDSDEWEDTIVVDQLRRVALDAADAAGVRFLKKMAATPTIDGATNDLQAADDGVNPPEILYLSSVVVTP